MKRAMLVLVVFLSCAFEARAQDTDLDGIPDAIDNCKFRSNPKQLDPDLDGYGNSCDADFDQDGDTDEDDAELFSWCIGQLSELCDLNENGVVGDLGDWGTFSSLFGLPPGPSGLDCAGTVPCLAPAGVPALGGAGMAGLLLTLIASAVAVRRRWMTA